MACNDKKDFHTLIFFNWSNLSKIGGAYIQCLYNHCKIWIMLNATCCSYRLHKLGTLFGLTVTTVPIPALTTDNDPVTLTFDLWPGKSIGFQILLRIRYVPSLVKIHWRMLILECSQGCYTVKIFPSDLDLENQ